MEALEGGTVDCKNGHRTCRNCLRKIQDMAAEEWNLRCPMCRVLINPSLLDKLMEEVPPGGAAIRLVVGNTHENVAARTYGSGGENVRYGSQLVANSHKWKCFVDVSWLSRPANNERLSAADLVAAVTFDLHPTFRPARVRVETAEALPGPLLQRTSRFAIQRVGWGAFELGITVHFKHGQGERRFRHMLRFDDFSERQEERHPSHTQFDAFVSMSADVPISAEALAGRASPPPSPRRQPLEGRRSQAVGGPAGARDDGPRLPRLSAPRLHSPPPLLPLSPPRSPPNSSAPRSSVEAAPAGTIPRNPAPSWLNPGYEEALTRARNTLTGAEALAESILRNYPAQTPTTTSRASTTRRSTYGYGLRD